MDALLIRDVLLEAQTTDILIRSGRIVEIGSSLTAPAGCTLIEGRGKAAFPSLANMHTHAAMSLLRGYGADKPLQEWLNQWIWPAEKRLDDDAIYWGARLACAEMIKSGTTAFCDMYFHIPSSARAAGEMGIRCTLGLNAFGDADEMTEALVEQTLSALEPYTDRVKLALAPHSIYTVSPKGLQRTARLSQRYGLLYHIHMNETETEVQDCLRLHGCRPYQLLERLGVMELTEGRLVGAHSLYVNDEEVALIGHHHATVVHNPASNLKLGSGHFFRYNELRDAGANVTLGTDGCASSDNLDMIEAARMMAYLQKGIRRDPTVLPTIELQQVVSKNGFAALGIDAGEIAVGREADLMLVDLDNLAMVPGTNPLNHLFYAAHGDAVDTVIAGGRLLMQGRSLPDEDDIRREARLAARKLLN